MEGEEMMDVFSLLVGILVGLLLREVEDHWFGRSRDD